MTDSQDAMFARLKRPDGKPTWPFFVRRSSGKAEISLQYLKDNPAFAAENARTAILDQMRSLPGVPVTTVKPTGWPAVPLVDLAKDDVWRRYIGVVRGIIERNQSTGSAQAPQS